MNGADDRIMEEAIAWHHAMRESDMDWGGFTDWLEADPRHRAAFDEVELTASLLDDHGEFLSEAAAVPDSSALEPPARRKTVWLRWSGAAIAASLVAVIGFQQFRADPAELYQTSATARTIALDDGSRIELAPHSRLQISGSGGRELALSGGAWFDIVHDPSRPLTIGVGPVEITDIGTKFDVQAAAGLIRVAVADGEVKVSAAALAEPVRLTRGRGLTFDQAGGTAVVRPVDAAGAGDWREGRLSYDSAPLALVATDLSRYAGVQVTVAQSLRDRRFTGTLVSGNGEAALRDLSQLMGIELGRDGDRYRLDP